MDANEVKQAVVLRLGGDPLLLEVRDVQVALSDGSVCRTLVHVFDLQQHTFLSRVFAWCGRRGKREVVHVVPAWCDLSSPEAAVRRLMDRRKPRHKRLLVAA